jgi:hypothetical protein
MAFLFPLGVSATPPLPPRSVTHPVIEHDGTATYWDPLHLRMVRGARRLPPWVLALVSPSEEHRLLKALA